MKKNKIIAGIIAGVCAVGGGFALTGCFEKPADPDTGIETPAPDVVATPTADEAFAKILKIENDFFATPNAYAMNVNLYGYDKTTVYTWDFEKNIGLTSGMTFGGARVFEVFGEWYVQSYGEQNAEKLDEDSLNDLSVVSRNMALPVAANFMRDSVKVVSPKGEDFTIEEFQAVLNEMLTDSMMKAQVQSQGTLTVLTWDENVATVQGETKLSLEAVITDGTSGWKVIFDISYKNDSITGWGQQIKGADGEIIAYQNITYTNEFNQEAYESWGK